MVAVGFSAGVDTGLWAIGTYFVVQTFDGYVLHPDGREGGRWICPPR